MQGIRRLELSPGETTAILGLGLIGQTALKLATAMGYRAYGFDINQQRVEHARQYNKPRNIVNSSSSDSIEQIMDLTNGIGVDGVLICASSKDDAIINQAFEMCRRRGRVSVVGDIGLNLQRAKMYAKELEVRLSCSYGAGRYDNTYELYGQDYPLAYARWTERRNLEYFINLLSENRLDLANLISDKFKIDNAKQAYSLVKTGSGSAFGVLLDYGMPEAPILKSSDYTIRYTDRVVNKEYLNIGLIGVGAYAKNVHVPNLKKISNVEIRAIASRSGGTAAVSAKKIGAIYATSNVGEIYSDEAIDAVVISTRHASHAQLVIDALNAGKHVFVEKPMATTTADCLRIIKAQDRAKNIVRIGFNRRFSPYLKDMRRIIGVGKKIFNIRVNVGNVREHWSNNKDEGGRLLGEGVHFFDLANWMIESKPIVVSAQFVGEPDAKNADASITIQYENGSIANISYITIGHVGRGKEFFELFGNGRSAVLDDYKKFDVFGARGAKSFNLKNSKGQADVLVEFINSVRGTDDGQGADSISGLFATAIYEAALESALSKCSIYLEEFIARQKV
jgi:predicted dehydrogenase